jgi:hypothetical protein
MRALIPFLLLAAALHGQTNKVSLAWDYDTSAMTTSLVFRVWHSPEATIAVTNWANVATFKVITPPTPGQHFYTVSAAYETNAPALPPALRFDGSKKGKL